MGSLIHQLVWHKYVYVFFLSLPGLDILGLILRRVSAKFVPTFAADNLQNLLREASDYKNILKNVVTSARMWVQGNDVENEQHLSQWRSPALPHPKRAEQVGLQVRAMLLVFFSTIEALCVINSCLKVTQSRLCVYVLRCPQDVVQ
jgi:hypothetical protein